MAGKRQPCAWRSRQDASAFLGGHRPAKKSWYSLSDRGLPGAGSTRGATADIIRASRPGGESRGWGKRRVGTKEQPAGHRLLPAGAGTSCPEVSLHQPCPQGPGGGRTSEAKGRKRMKKWEKKGVGEEGKEEKIKKTKMKKKRKKEKKVEEN